MYIHRDARPLDPRFDYSSAAGAKLLYIDIDICVCMCMYIYTHTYIEI